MGKPRGNSEKLTGGFLSVGAYFIAILWYNICTNLREGVIEGKGVKEEKKLQVVRHPVEKRGE